VPDALPSVHVVEDAAETKPDSATYQGPEKDDPEVARSLIAYLASLLDTPPKQEH
jgi:hypothetical protein